MQYQDLDQPSTASILANSSNTDAGIISSIRKYCRQGVLFWDSANTSQEHLRYLSALPDIGFEFVGWTGAITGDASDQVLSVDGDAIVTATFTRQNIDFGYY